MHIDIKPLGIIADNDTAYFSLLQAAVESIDEYSNVIVSRGPESYIFRLSPSHPMYIDSLIDAIIKLNTLLKIHVNFSKSMKNSCNISFSIPIIQ